MMLNNSYKADQAKELKTKLEFDFILKLILNLDCQRKTSEAKSMKISSKPKNKKKDLRDFYLYCSRLGYIEGKCYCKHPKHASQNFWEKFKDWI